MKEYSTHILLILVICILSYFIFNSAFQYENGTLVPSCESYVKNSYLYLCLSFFVIVLLVQLLKKTTFLEHFTLSLSFLLFLLTLICIVALSIMPHDYILTTHLIWFFIIGALTCIMYPLIVLKSSSVPFALVTTAVLLLLMTLFAHVFHDTVTQHVTMFGFALFITLITVILVELYLIFISGYPEKLHRIISYFVIFLFCLFILYDTVNMKNRALTCSYPERPANYPKESLGLILDLINIFVRTLAVSR